MTTSTSSSTGPDTSTTPDAANSLASLGLQLQRATRRENALKYVLASPAVVKFLSRASDLAVSHLMDSGLKLGSPAALATNLDLPGSLMRSHFREVTDPVSGGGLTVVVSIEGHRSETLFGCFDAHLELRPSVNPSMLGLGPQTPIARMALVSIFNIPLLDEPLDWSEALLQHLVSNLKPLVKLGQLPHLEVAMSNFRKLVDAQLNP